MKLELLTENLFNSINTSLTVGRFKNLIAETTDSLCKIRNKSSQLNQEEGRDPKFRNIWKKFYEELRPLARYMAKNIDIQDDAEIYVNTGNQSYDCQIVFSDGQKLYIEVGSPRDGHFESYMFQHLEEYGHCPVYAEGGVDELKSAIKSGIPSPGEARDTNEILSELTEQVQTCLNKKSENKNYPKPCILLVYVDDGGIHQRNRLVSLAHLLKIPKTHQFKSIVLFGRQSDEQVTLVR